MSFRSVMNLLEMHIYVAYSAELWKKIIWANKI